MPDAEGCESNKNTWPNGCSLTTYVLQFFTWCIPWLEDKEIDSWLEYKEIDGKRQPSAPSVEKVTVNNLGVRILDHINLPAYCVHVF